MALSKLARIKKAELKTRIRQIQATNNALDKKRETLRNTAYINGAMCRNLERIKDAERLIKIIDSGVYDEVTKGVE